MCFLGVWKREKKCREAGREQDSKKCDSPLVCGVPGAIYSLDMLFKVATLKGPPASTSSNWVNLEIFGKVLTSCF